MGTDTEKYASKERANRIAKDPRARAVPYSKWKFRAIFFGEAIKQTAARQIPQAKKSAPKIRPTEKLLCSNGS